MRSSQKQAENDGVLDMPKDALSRKIDERIDSRLEEILSKYEDKLEKRWKKYEKNVISKIEPIIDSKIATATDQMQAEITSLSSTVDACKAETLANSAEIKELRSSTPTDTQNADTIQEEINKLKAKCTSLEAQLHEHKRMSQAESKEVASKIEAVEYHSRKLNLVFEGVHFNEGENCKHKIEAIIHQTMHLEMPGVIDVAHRQYNAREMSNKVPVVVRFKTLEAKQRVLQNSKALKDTNISLRMDVPAAYSEKRSYMFKFLKSALAVDPNAVVVRDRLRFNKRMYTMDTIDTVKFTDEEHTIETESQVRFYGMLSPFSNFYKCKFTMNGLQFTCVEQALMYFRARNHDDHYTAYKIKHEKNPAVIKRLGNRYKPTTSEASARERAFLERAVMAKFSSNDDLKQALINTNQKTMLECNPYDSVYSTGMKTDDPKLDTLEFTGANIMGQILEKTRAQLQETTASE